MATILVNVDDEVAKAFSTAPEEERKEYESIIDNQLRGAIQQRKLSLVEMMRRMSRTAKANGMTPEILESILNEKE
ncbi:MAG TPA: hypothetical protein VK137_18670 [Planctomycetaceae bacterium]|nr:hypothetical protein [Planctomycetaceae bacterium]